jgi:hypothetical protein
MGAMQAHQLPPHTAATPELVPITDTPALRAAGIYWPTTAPSWRWQYLRRHDYGTAEAFVRVGRRLLVNVPAFKRIIAERAGQERSA